MTADGGSVLCVGLCCLDLVATCDSFPQEDTDQRVASIRWCVGGNAAHNAMLLAALEPRPVHFAGCLPSEQSPNGGYLLRQLAHCGVSTHLCKCHPDAECPVSSVIVNSSNGSRTILHSPNDMPEYTLADFTSLDLLGSGVNWVHFEGRPNVSEIAEMLRHVRRVGGGKIKTSVEAEKSRKELTELLPLADYVFVSRDFAALHGASDKVDAVRRLLPLLSSGRTVGSSGLICAWGAAGAACGSSADSVASVPAASPTSGAVVDTLGAGDAFFAACVHGLRRGLDLRRATAAGAVVAADKCGVADSFGCLPSWAAASASAAFGKSR